MTALDFRLERSILIRAQRATVYSFFTDSERFARWWGPGSRIEPREGGAVEIRYPNGIVARGEVVELEADRRIAFTFGYESGKPMGPGESRVEIELHDEAGGTRLELRHACGSAAIRDAHEAGWRYQLAVFANVAADAQHAGIAETVDRFFAAWGETDASARARALELCTTPDVEFRDAFGCVAGREEFAAHIAAVQAHVPGRVPHRRGAPRHCQGVALVDWDVRGSGGPENGGTNMFRLAPDGRVAEAVAFRGALQ